MRARLNYINDMTFIYSIMITLSVIVIKVIPIWWGIVMLFVLFCIWLANPSLMSYKEV